LKREFLITESSKDKGEFSAVFVSSSLENRIGDVAKISFVNGSPNGSGIKMKET
jgi:hypothetical protein